MSRHSWPILLIVFVLSPGPARADDAPLAVAPQPGILLLRNGQVLSGNITEAGDYFYVALPSGEIRLPADQVELACHDLQQGYERKHARIDPDSVMDHLELATWCIRQKLYDSAAQEIVAARSLDARHPRISLVERQLTLAQALPAHADHKLGGDSPIPSNDDLDRLLRGMPPGTVETFSNTIQPLLLNTCGTAGCHGPQSEAKMRLSRTQFGKTSNRRFTQRNLHAVLEMIDRAEPRASPLLTVPVAPHGTAKAAIFTNKEVAQYRQLTQWVMRVSQAVPPPQPASVERPDDNLLQTLPARGQAEPQPQSPNQLLVGPGGDPPPAAPGQAGSRAAATKGVAKKPGPKRPSVDESSSDPFDPEVFNRRFFPPQ
jgi:hypothetical protein